MVAGFIAFTPILFKILIRGEYDAAYQQMSFLYIGMYFSCMAAFVGGIYVAHMKTKSVGITTLMAAVCNLVIDVATMKIIGLYAASISTLVAYALLFFFRLIDVQKFQPLEIKYSRLFAYLAIITAMSIMVAQRCLWLDLIDIIVGIVFAVTININLIKTIITGIFHRKKG